MNTITIQQFANWFDKNDFTPSFSFYFVLPDDDITSDMNCLDKADKICFMETVCELYADENKVCFNGIKTSLLEVGVEIDDDCVMYRNDFTGDDGRRYFQLDIVLQLTK